jgi:hypothetical protein
MRILPMVASSVSTVKGGGSRHCYNTRSFVRYLAIGLEYIYSKILPIEQLLCIRRAECEALSIISRELPVEKATEKYLQQIEAALLALWPAE